MSYKHLSSTTLTTGRMPFAASLGAGTAARDPSPRNRGPSSHFVNCAASRSVNGLTRIVTEIEDAPSAVAMTV